MIEINLMPLKEVRRRETKRFQKSVSLLLAILLLLVIFYLKWSAQQREKDLDRRISDVKAEIARLDKVVGEVSKLKKEKEALKQRLEIAEGLEKGRLSAAMILNDLSRNIPDKLWLESLKKQEDRIEINGIALDDETIADFMIALKSSPYVKDVELSLIKKQPVEDVALRKFSLTYRFQVD